MAKGAVVGSLIVMSALFAACSASSSSTSSPAGTGSATASTGPVGPISAPGGQFLEDRYGRVVLFHGANLVYKVAPFEVVVSGTGRNVLTTAEVDKMQSMGFDMVRLGVIWKGLEPGTDPMNDPSICTPGAPTASTTAQFQPGVFDSYIQKLDATVKLLGEHGIYSLIDMHQDVYNEAFAGEGAPNWAVCTDGATPAPKFNVPDWSVNLGGPGVEQAYQNFWTNDVVGNLQGQFDALWARIAAHYEGDPYVAGYDPFNEPWGEGLPPTAYSASFDAELQCFYAGQSDPGVNQSGQPVSCPTDDPAQGVIPSIEQADPGHLVFYEPDYSTDSAVLPNHIGAMPFPRLVLNFHDYCLLHVPNGPEPASFTSTCTPLENQTFQEMGTDRANDATSQQPGGPAWILSEFGATVDTADLTRVTSDADAHLSGWLYWEWLNYDDPTGTHSGGLWPPTSHSASIENVLAQTYAQAVAGTPTSMSYNQTSADFHLTYSPSPSIKQPTVIYVPVSTHYAKGYCTSAHGARVTSAAGSQHVDLQNEPGAKTVTISITRGKC